MKLVIAGGGTGGHLFPGIAVAEEFLSRGKDNQVIFVGTSRGIEARAVPAAGYRLELISASGIRGKGLASQIKALLAMGRGFFESRRLLKGYAADMVLGVGGYASLPMVLAAASMGVCCYVHEQNAVPGMTNRLLARFVKRVYITLEESARFFPAAKVLLTGNPLRRQILGLVAASRGEAEPIDASTLGGGQKRLKVFVFGGSQGAHAINLALVEAMPLLKQSGLQLDLLHQTGERDYPEIAAAYERDGIAAQVVPFINDMAAAYRDADLVVCRAGATTIAEVTAIGKACLFIPFPHAVDDHQRKNAEALLRKNAAFMLLEKDLSGQGLAEMITALAGDMQRLHQTARQARGLARIDAAKIIVDAMQG